MIGNIDSTEDFLATGLCLRAGIAPTGQDSRSFLTGHRLGFLMGWLMGRWAGGIPVARGSSEYARTAYQDLLDTVKAGK